MGIGSARGDDRSVAAAEMAISSPLLEASIDGAHGVLLSIQGGSDLGLFEINEAAQLVANSAAPDANIIFGAVIDDALGDEVRVTVIAAGFDESGTVRRDRWGRAWPAWARTPPVPAMAGAATFPVANGEAGRDHGQSGRRGVASGATAGAQQPDHRAEQFPAVTMSEAMPEVTVTASPVAKAGAAETPAEPAAHSTEWPAAPVADSGSQDSRTKCGRRGHIGSHTASPGRPRSRGPHVRCGHHAAPFSRIRRG